MTVWLRSYANHILNCSLYSGITVYAVKYVTTLGTTTTTTTTKIGGRGGREQEGGGGWISPLILLLGGSIVAATMNLLLLYGEIQYMLLRFHLPPGDSGYPILGNVPTMLYLGMRQFYVKQIQKYGYPFTMNIFMTPQVFLSTNEDIQWILLQERKGNLIPTRPNHVKELMGPESIMYQISTKHKRLRRIFDPSFSPISIQKYTQRIDDIVKETLEKLYQKHNNTNHDQNEAFSSSTEWSLLAMRIFFICAFEDVVDDGEIFTKLHELFDIWMNGFLTAVPFKNIPGTRLYKGHAAREELCRILQTIANDFKRKNPPGSFKAENTMMGRICYGVDDEDGKTLTDEQLTTNMIFIVIAGHDTTKASFGTFLHFLNEYPKIKKLLIEEAQQHGFSAMEKEKKVDELPLNAEELKSGAPLLNAFMAESWRLVTPVPSRKLEATADLEYKGFKIRRGVRVVADITYHSCGGGGGGGSISSSSSDRSCFPDPTEFRLERWLPKDHPLHDPKYYLGDGVDYNTMSVKYFRTFGMGPHACLGAHFAKLEARIILTRLLQKYDIEIRNDKLLIVPLLQYSNEFQLSKR